jgi:hypothetical protein
LILTEEERTMDVGDNVFFDNLPAAYKVYVLCYLGVGADQALVQKLKDFGSETGNNCLINIAKLNDPNYTKVRKTFGIMTFPTIIITATGDLATPPSEYSTGFVRIDNKALMKSADLTFTCIEKMFNLFIDEKFTEALKVKTSDERMALIRQVLNDSLIKVKGFLKEWDISFSFTTGKLELKPREM